MSTVNDVTVRHLVDLARSLLPIDRSLAHSISHGAALRSARNTSGLGSLRKVLCPRCHGLLPDVERPPEEERCPTCYVEFSRRAKTAESRRHARAARKRRRDGASQRDDAEGDGIDSSDEIVMKDRCAADDGHSGSPLPHQPAAPVAPVVTSLVASSDGRSIVSSATSDAARRRARQAAAKSSFSALLASEAGKTNISGIGSSSISSQVLSTASGSSNSASGLSLFASLGDILGGGSLSSAVSFGSVSVGAPASSPAPSTTGGNLLDAKPKAKKAQQIAKPSAAAAVASAGLVVSMIAKPPVSSLLAFGSASVGLANTTGSQAAKTNSPAIPSKNVKALAKASPGPAAAGSTSTAAGAGSKKPFSFGKG